MRGLAALAGRMTWLGLVLRRALLLALLASGPLAAQDLSRLPLSPSRSPVGILVVDMERLFAQSAYWAEVNALVEARSTALNTENDRLQTELEAEVEALTVQRQELAPEAFRAAAAAFDEKVQAIRAAQDAKQAAIEAMVSTSQERFVASVNPVLERLMRTRGALLVLDQQLVRISDPMLDITDAAIAAVDRELAEGGLKIPDFAP